MIEDMSNYISAPTYKRIVLPNTEEFGWHGDNFISTQQVTKNRINFVVKDMIQQDDEYRKTLSDK